MTVSELINILQRDFSDEDEVVVSNPKGQILQNFLFVKRVASAKMNEINSYAILKVGE